MAQPIIPKYKYYDESFVPEPFGLQNTGAICWGNSLIQFFLGMSAINKVLLEQENNLANNAFATEYIKLLKLILPNDGNLYSGDMEMLSLSSCKILTAMINRMQSKKININMGAGQECADEAFAMFVEMLGCPEVECVLESKHTLGIKCTTCGEITSSNDTAFRIELFTDVVATTAELFVRRLIVNPVKHDRYQCKCGAVMYNFYAMEKLKRLGEVVVIVFNKFQAKTNKWFPESFTMPGIVDNLNYKLIGKIEHSGSAGGGHYWAQSLRDDWTLLDDNNMPGIGDSLPRVETFMVAYHLVK